MNNEQGQLKRFQISTAAAVPMVVVDARDEAEALERAMAIAHVARLPLDPRGLNEWGVDEMHPAQPATVPYYREGYFLLHEADGHDHH
jgi:hypothetical protein